MHEVIIYAVRFGKDLKLNPFEDYDLLVCQSERNKSEDKDAQQPQVQMTWRLVNSQKNDVPPKLLSPADLGQALLCLFFQNAHSNHLIDGEPVVQPSPSSN